MGNTNAATRRYEKTKQGFLMRTYRNMQSRVGGVQAKKAHLYQGLYLLPRSEFYSWALTNTDFNLLFNAWEAEGYPRKLTPSIDRLDPARGYELPNMQWITHSENSGLRGKHD